MSIFFFMFAFSARDCKIATLKIILSPYKFRFVIVYKTEINFYKSFRKTNTSVSENTLIIFYYYILFMTSPAIHMGLCVSTSEIPIQTNCIWPRIFCRCNSIRRTEYSTVKKRKVPYHLVTLAK